MKKILILWLLCTVSSFSEETDRFRFHSLCLQKIEQDPKLNNLNRQTKSLYKKLNKTFSKNAEIAKILEEMKGKLGKERVGLVKKLKQAQADYLKAKPLVAEEVNEINDKITKLNQSIYQELMKDPQIAKIAKSLNTP